MSGESILQILDELAERIENARTIPMSASVLVNKFELLDLIAAGSALVPEQVDEADRYLAESTEMRAAAERNAQEIVADARAQAEQIMTEANEQAARLVASDSVTITAKSQAAKILDEANLESEKLRTGANDYSQSILDELAGQLEALQDQIAAGRELLVQRVTEANEE